MYTTYLKEIFKVPEDLEPVVMLAQLGLYVRGEFQNFSSKNI